jgi:hypothetical protein
MTFPPIKGSNLGDDTKKADHESHNRTISTHMTSIAECPTLAITGPVIGENWRIFVKILAVFLLIGVIGNLPKYSFMGSNSVISPLTGIIQALISFIFSPLVLAIIHQQYEKQPINIKKAIQIIFNNFWPLIAVRLRIVFIILGFTLGWFCLGLLMHFINNWLLAAPILLCSTHVCWLGFKYYLVDPLILFGQCRAKEACHLSGAMVKLHPWKSMKSIGLIWLPFTLLIPILIALMFLNSRKELYMWESLLLSLVLLISQIFSSIYIYYYSRWAFENLTHQRQEISL